MTRIRNQSFRAEESRAIKKTLYDKEIQLRGVGSVAVRGSDPGDGVTIKSRGEGYPGDMRPGR